MKLEETLQKINKGREKAEACFVFSCWNDPDLFEDYSEINEGNSDTLRNKDAKFYWKLGLTMYNQGVRKFDAISIETFLSNKENIKKKYDEYGGYQTIKELRSLVDPENVQAYYDRILKMNSLTMIATKYDEIFEDVARFDNASSADVFDTFDLLNSSVFLKTNQDTQIEDLQITDAFIEKCQSGENMGLSYGEAAPLLNYTTLGAPLSDIFLFTGFSGTGKSSWIFENMVLPISKTTPVGILSNEMKIDAYQNMLLAHILTKDLNYWKLTRKKIKIGDYTEEDLAMITQAKKISQEKYKNIKFVKVFANDSNMIMKYMRQLSHMGVSFIAWDTFKGDDVADGSDAWYQLLKSSRKIFNLASKLNIALVCTFQLALRMTNQRYLDASCLSASKQVKEVVSELVMMRKLWDDEYTGQKYDCKPYRFKADNKKIKETIDLDPDKEYLVIFVNKTRNDASDKQILYEWRASWNRWYEIGYCNIRNDHNSTVS